jgi:MFS family permease
MTTRPRVGGIILASALMTFDGTATTIALPAISRDLSASMAHLQWIVNAPLVVLTAMLLTGGALADRFGRVRTIRLGLLLFAAASLVCAVSTSHLQLIAAKFLQGGGGALVLPGALAALRDAGRDSAERTRLFGVWAAWTGAASVAGPLLAGALVDIGSWRIVFIPSIAAAAIALAALWQHSEGTRSRSTVVPVTATAALVVVLGAFAYLLVQAPRGDLTVSRLSLPVVLAIAGGVLVGCDPQRHRLFPRELVNTRNCLTANATTFALYFGVFGLSFLVVLYAQQVERVSALSSAIIVSPMSAMLLLAERFGKLATVAGARALVVSGAVCASAGIAWIALGPHPVPVWSHILVGTAVFGLGVSLAVSTLTHAAVAAVPATCAGTASGLNHAVVRAAGLVAVALLGSIAAPGVSDEISADGFRRAMVMCAAIVGAGGVASAVLLRGRPL